MSNNANQIVPGYVEIDLRKGKTAKAVRNRKKERKIYLYKTSELLVDVEESKTSSKIVQPAYDKSIDLNSTTPLNGDIAKPKFAILSDSQVWSGQINGFVYEEIDFNPDLYNFISFTLLQNDTIQTSAKYRLVNYSPEYDNNNKFMYATITMVRETNKTIPGLDRISWILTQKLLFDTKTKYIKITLPAETQIDPEGFKASIITDAGIRRSVGLKVNACTELTYKFIKVRGTSPYVFDDMTYINFQDPKIRSGALIEWKNESPFPNTTPDSYPAGIKLTQNSVDANVGGIDIDGVTSEIDDYFTKGAFKITGRSTSVLTQKDIIPNELTAWISGNTIFGNQIVPSGSDDLTIETKASNVSDLDNTAENDRKYYIVTKKTDMTKVGLASGRQNNPGLQLENSKYKWLYIDRKVKFNLLNKESASKYFQDQDDPIVIELELSLAGKNVGLDVITRLADNVKMTTYDEKHNVLLNDVSVETEFKFNNAKRATYIQL